MSTERINLDEWTKAVEVAAKLDVHIETVRQWIASGRCPRARKVGWCWYLHYSDIDGLFVEPEPPRKLRDQKTPKTPAYARRGLDQQLWGK